MRFRQHISMNRDGGAGFNCLIVDEWVWLIYFIQCPVALHHCATQHKSSPCLQCWLGCAWPDRRAGRSPSPGCRLAERRTCSTRWTRLASTPWPEHNRLATTAHSSRAPPQQHNRKYHLTQLMKKSTHLVRHNGLGEILLFIVLGYTKIINN